MEPFDQVDGHWTELRGSGAHRQAGTSQVMRMRSVAKSARRTGHSVDRLLVILCSLLVSVSVTKDF